MHNHVDVLSTGCTSSGRLWWNQVRPKYKQWDNTPFEVEVEYSHTISEFLEYMTTTKKNKVTVAPKTAPSAIVKKQFAYPKAATFWLADVKFNRQTVLGLPFVSLPQVILMNDRFHIFKVITTNTKYFCATYKNCRLGDGGIR
jgi:hypothetical protein